MTAGLHPQWIIPDWPAPAVVRALITTRAGGKSRGPYGAPAGAGGGMNIGLKCGDDANDVRANRARLRAVLPAEPDWLRQVHGAEVACIEESDPLPVADAAMTRRFNRVCAVSIADCLPVLLAEERGRCVGVAHAGWRGLAAGVIQNLVAAMRARTADASLLAYLGPAIGPTHFEVGSEVLAAMRERLPMAGEAFSARPGGKYLADLFALARQALAQSGVGRVFGGGACTFSDPARFYSFRRDGVTGRHVALIWMTAEGDRSATASV